MVVLAGFLLDISTTGMKVDTDFSPRIGDQVRVDLPDFTVRAEVLHSVGIHGRVDVGLKLAQPLDREQLLKCRATCLQPT
jgi:phage tail tube protein FII